MIAQKDETYSKVYAKVQEISQDEANRLEFEAREKARRDEVARRQFAEEEAAKKAYDKAHHEIALNLLPLLDDEAISKTTGLSLSEVISLRANQE